jgi:hypothetical protein
MQQPANQCIMIFLNDNHFIKNTKNSIFAFYNC